MNPKVVRDRDGDVWSENKDGRFCMVGGEWAETLDYIRKAYGPLEVATFAAEEI